MRAVRHATLALALVGLTSQAMAASSPSNTSCGLSVLLPSCPSGSFCLHEPSGDCGGTVINPSTGVCKSIPDACTDIYQPVCGCDGVTYASDCMAHAAAVSVKAEGPCLTGGASNTTTCGGLMGKACPVASQYCRFPDGSCGAGDRMGVCETIPDACNYMSDPVCGCDGKTYGNACAASSSGVSVLSKGACGTAAPVVCGEGVGMCEALPGYYCRFTAGVCGRYKQQGVCTARPAVCNHAVLPVCGCDGHTYENECAASRGNVSVAAIGECPFQPYRPEEVVDQKDAVPLSSEEDVSLMGTNGTTSAKCIISESQFGKACPKGFFCSFNNNTCGNSGSVSGICVSVPMGCATDKPTWPVCGCDGQTYSSECDAAASRTSLRSSTDTCEEIRDKEAAAKAVPTSAAPRSVQGAGVVMLAVLAMAHHLIAAF